MPEFDGTATKRTCVNVSDVLINAASDRSQVAWPWLGCSCSASLAARSGKSFNAAVDVLVLVVVIDCWSYGQMTCLIRSEAAALVAQDTVESRERSLYCRSGDWQQQQ